MTQELFELQHSTANQILKPLLKIKSKQLKQFIPFSDVLVLFSDHLKVEKWRSVKKMLGKYSWHHRFSLVSFRDQRHNINIDFFPLHKKPK